MTLLASYNAIDAAVIVVYLFASFGIGIVASRWLHTKEDEEGYYLAGRKLPGWANGISYAVTAMNADVAPLYCGLAVVVGLPTAWYYLSRFAFAWLIVALLFAVHWRCLAISTGPEFYSLRFGGKGSKLVRIYTALFSVVVNMIPWIGAGLLGTHKIFGPVFEIENKATTLALILPILVGYVWIAGFAGVVVTDVLQSAVIILASILLLASVLTKFGGPSGLSQAIVESHPEEHTEILSVFPVPGHEILGPLVVLAWFIVPTIGRGGNVDLEGQRLFSARSAYEAAKVPLWAACSLFAMLLLLTLPVLGILASYPEMYHSAPSVREETYGMMMKEYLPVGLLGIALAALLASVMSTIDSHLNYGAQTIVNDVLRQIFPHSKLLDPQTKTCVWIGRLTMLVILGCGISVMFAADSLFRIATIVAGMFGASAAFFWAQWWWWRVNFASWVAAMIGGPVVYFGLGWLLPKWTWWGEYLAISPAKQDELAMLQAVIAIGFTSVLWVATALLTRPESDETLATFYRRARPLGAWRPVLQNMEEHQDRSSPSRGLFVNGLLLAMLGAVTIASLVLGVSQLTVGGYATGGALGLIAVIGFFIFMPRFRQHVARMEQLHNEQ